MHQAPFQVQDIEYRDKPGNGLAAKEWWRGCVQGLELDSNGKVMGRPRGAELQQIREEQEAWGASSEKASHAFLENLALTGAKAAGNAGMPVSLSALLSV